MWLHSSSGKVLYITGAQAREHTHRNLGAWQQAVMSTGNINLEGLGTQRSLQNMPGFWRSQVLDCLLASLDLMPGLSLTSVLLEIEDLDHELHQDRAAHLMQPVQGPEECVVDCWQVVSHAFRNNVVQHIAAVR